MYQNTAMAATEPVGAGPAPERKTLSIESAVCALEKTVNELYARIAKLTVTTSTLRNVRNEVNEVGEQDTKIAVIDDRGNATVAELEKIRTAIVLMADAVESLDESFTD